MGRRERPGLFFGVTKEQFEWKEKSKRRISRMEVKARACKKGGCGIAVGRKFEVGVEKRGHFLLSQPRATEFQARHERLGGL